MIVTFTFAAAVQPFTEVTVTLYTPALFRTAEVNELLGKKEEKEFGPDHWYMLPPEAFTKREVFSQRGEFVCNTGTGNACKIIEAVAAAVQPNAEPMTVYC